MANTIDRRAVVATSAEGEQFEHSNERGKVQSSDNNIRFATIPRDEIFSSASTI